jgi:RNA polymerase sigma-70 factor (ECF subfamily)
VFTTGHTAPIGERLVRADLLDEGLHLARLMHQLLPEDAEAGGLLALILLTDARRATRTSATGELVLLRDQDRSRWDRRMIGEGRNILLQTLAGYPPNRYTIQAAVAAVHADAPTWQDTDWAEIVALYDVLRTLWPSPVVELNRGIAIGLGEGPQAGLVALAPLLNEPALAAYHYLSAARADFLRQLARWDEAITSYEEALALTDNEVEHAFLRGRLDEVHAERDQAR